MQRREVIGLLRQHMRMEHIGEEVVIAIPVALVIQRDEKVVAALQDRQPRVAPCLPGDGLAQRAAQAVEDGGVEQEAADSGGLAPQHLLHQIVHDVAVIPGERPDEAGGVRAPLHRERGELQAGDPALSALLQCGDIALREREAHRLREKRGGFGGGEAQVGCAQLSQLAAGA